MIHLEKVSIKNLEDIIDLKTAKDQENFVAENVESLAEAYTTIGTDCTAFPFGIYDDDTPVGFLMIGHNEAAMYDILGEKPAEALRNGYSIWRFMIDETHQRKGYGKEAMMLALDFIRTWPCGEAEYCEISYEPENSVAREMYHAFGFEENGEMDGDEIVAVLKL